MVLYNVPFGVSPTEGGAIINHDLLADRKRTSGTRLQVDGHPAEVKRRLTGTWTVGKKKPTSLIKHRQEVDDG